MTNYIPSVQQHHFLEALINSWDVEQDTLLRACWISRYNGGKGPHLMKQRWLPPEMLEAKDSDIDAVMTEHLKHTPGRAGGGRYKIER